MQCCFSFEPDGHGVLNRNVGHAVMPTLPLFGSLPVLFDLIVCTTCANKIRRPLERRPNEATWRNKNIGVTDPSHQFSLAESDNHGNILHSSDPL